MNLTLHTGSAVLCLLLVSCAVTRLPISTAPPAWVNKPSGGKALKADWWQEFGDPALDKLISQGWDANPEIEASLKRVEVARADRFEAMAAFFPKASVSAGLLQGREQDRSTGYRPDDIEPIRAGGELSWELDITGKRRALLASTKAAQAAAYARWRGARLLVATEIALARFEEQILGAEIETQKMQMTSEEKAIGMNDALFRQGLLSSNNHAAAVSSFEAARRELSDLERRRSLARLRLERLCGGSTGIVAQTGRLPLIPPSPVKAPAAVWGSRPDLVAAEGDLRNAFAALDASKLNLLPTLSFGAGGSLGTHSLSGQVKTWEISAGPRLEIPVWDPARIASVKRSNATAGEVAANYRATALRAAEEIEGAYVNLSLRRNQLASAIREREAAKTAWAHAQAKYRAGEGSFGEENTAAGRYRDSSLRESGLRLQSLEDYLALVKALGG